MLEMVSFQGAYWICSASPVEEGFPARGEVGAAKTCSVWWLPAGSGGGESSLYLYTWTAGGMGLEIPEKP